MWPGFYLSLWRVYSISALNVTNVVACYSGQVFHDFLNSCHCSCDWAGLRPVLSAGPRARLKLIKIQLKFNWKSNKIHWIYHDIYIEFQWTFNEIHWHPLKSIENPLEIQWTALASVEIHWKSIGNPLEIHWKSIEVNWHPLKSIESHGKSIEHPLNFFWKTNQNYWNSSKINWQSIRIIFTILWNPWTIRGIPLNSNENPLMPIEIP